MKHVIKQITAVLLIIALLCPICPAFVFGASKASISMSGSTNVKQGEVLTITVTYKGSGLGYVNGHLTYDTDQLEYLSGGSSQGNAGLVQLKAYADDASGKLSFPVKFRAVGSGRAGLNLETLESQNLDGDQDMGTPSSGMTVQIAKGTSAAVTDSSQETTEQDETQESTQSVESSEAPGLAEDEKESLEQTEDKGSASVTPFVAGAVLLILIIAVILAVLVRKKRQR